MKTVNENTIVINNSYDLYSLSYSDIKNTKLYNFAGDYYNQIYKEALEIEKSNINIKDIPLSLNGMLIENIEIEIEYKTEFGQCIKILGSLPEMGKWDFSKGLELKWHPNNLWKAKIKFYESFEIKFVLKEQNSNLRWEVGANRKINLVDVKEELQKISSKKKTLKKDQMEFTYDPDSKTLIIKCFWKYA